MAVGGCPAPQTPTTPSEEEDGDSTLPTPTSPENGVDRPVQPPDLDDTETSDSGETVPSGPGDQGGAGGGGDEGAVVDIAVRAPADPVAVRANTVVNLVFELVDLTGAVKSGELLLARDRDRDGEADDDPVLARSIELKGGTNTIGFNTNEALGLLDDGEGLGYFVLGVRATTISDERVGPEYSDATLTIDTVEPTVAWLGAGPNPGAIDQEDHLVSRTTDWTVKISTTDNSPVAVRILLDLDQDKDNGNEFELASGSFDDAGTATREFADIPLAPFPAGTYYYCVIVSDDVGGPEPAYAYNGAAAKFPRLAITNRLIGDFLLEKLAETPDHPSESNGAILQGFNFNDLAGSSMASVPDLTGDGASELIIGSRFGKPNLSGFSGQGWGEAYLIYGEATRMGGIQELNSVGDVGSSGGGIPGVIFRGVRVPQNTDLTEGLADISVIDDMDGDDLPEIVFSFPRAESISLGVGPDVYPPGVPWYQIQHPDLAPDEDGMGAYEFNAYHNAGEWGVYDSPTWNTDEAQFTRGGIVIVSSHNDMLRDNTVWTRKGDRILDLHEVGQMFEWMTRASLACYIRQVYIGDPNVIDPNSPGCWDCEPDSGECGGDPNNPQETEYDYIVRLWDVWLGGG
jgi:hypothetical protein